ncbi:hypothetical protein [Enterobacter kobei]|uniref:hypothetical protein n=1 Tax=Enterobacter kobei TaxID=208224 RepID=UPI0032AE86EC
MSTITKEQLRERAREKVKSLEFAVTQAAFADSRAELEEELELARIALASLEAGPAIHRWRRVTSEPYGPYPWHYGDFIGFSKPVDGIEDEYFYSAPPATAPVSDEDKVLAEQARAVIHCLDMCGVPSGDYADNEQLQLWGRVIEYGRHPASVSVPAAMEMDDDFDSAFEHGKAVGWNAYRAVMLQGADRPQNEPQNIPENIPATQFKPVADLYGLTSPTGGETSFTFDAVEARDFVDGGWSCQEYVELERFQEAVSGNSPVIQGCSCLTCRPVTFSDSRFVVCPECGNKRCPHANDHRNACTGSNEPGQEGSAYPAAPQQEA